MRIIEIKADINNITRMPSFLLSLSLQTPCLGAFTVQDSDNKITVRIY
jgi:hypothetical protein